MIFDLFTGKTSSSGGVSRSIREKLHVPKRMAEALRVMRGLNLVGTKLMPTAQPGIVFPRKKRN